ncbi:hypothetical protein O988_08044 [Pseudogymnoascus sp. VKM F-3808]|nr:hypothetical protein O988_08044 [Pseudogymnoascus sp. VKM F-3808]
MYAITALAYLAGLAASMPLANTGLSLTSNNVAVYWGQNSHNQGTGPLAQQRLSYYCSNSDIDIIPIAFLTTLGDLSLNLANAGDKCTAISGSNLFYCSELEEDIPACQSQGKTILLSVGGATYTEGGFSSEDAAVTAANNVWASFGPKSGDAPRPFGGAAVDGFDFDFETTVSNMPAFANQLRSLMDQDTSSSGKKWLLTAAPQCPYPDAADGPMLAGTVSFDAIWVQFYNNYCGLQSFVEGSDTQNNFNFNTWDNWAKTVSKNPDVKIFVGAPGSPTAAGGGYVDGSTLTAIITYAKTFSSFGGVMIWDMSQVYSNDGFLDNVRASL